MGCVDVPVMAGMPKKRKIDMAKFYVNCALKEDVNMTCAKVTKKYYDDRLKSCLANFPLPVVKISSVCKSCYAQIRLASDLYKSNFNNYISFSGEKEIFEKSNYGELPILFISEHYRDLLGIDIKQNVNNQGDVNYNIKELEINPTHNLFSYLYYVIRATYDYPEIYSFFMFIIAIFGLTLALSPVLIKIIDSPSIIFCPAFLTGLFLLLFSLLMPVRLLPFRFSLSILLISIFIILYSASQTINCYNFSII